MDCESVQVFPPESVPVTGTPSVRLTVIFLSLALTPSPSLPPSLSPLPPSLPPPISFSLPPSLSLSLSPALHLSPSRPRSLSLSLSPALYLAPSLPRSRSPLLYPPPIQVSYRRQKHKEVTTLMTVAAAAELTLLEDDVYVIHIRALSGGGLGPPSDPLHIHQISTS